MIDLFLNIHTMDPKIIPSGGVAKKKMGWRIWRRMCIFPTLIKKIMFITIDREFGSFIH